MTNLIPAPSLLLCEACGTTRSESRTEVVRVPFPLIEGASRVIVVCDDSPVCRDTVLERSSDPYPDGAPANVLQFDERVARRL